MNKPCPVCENYHPENYIGDCRDDRFRADSPFRWFSTSSGRIEFQIAQDDASTGSHQGRCDEDIEALRTLPRIKHVLEPLKPGVLAAELREYGAWDETQLKNHDENLTRILWLACGDIVDNILEEEVEL